MKCPIGLDKHPQFCSAGYCDYCMRQRGYRPVTCWRRYNKQSESFEHNHIEFGHAEHLDEPSPMSDEQAKSWHGARWKKELGYISKDMKVVTAIKAMNDE